MTYSLTHRDLYAVLGIKPNAGGDAIRRAYRLLARELHPDVNPAPDAARRFAEVSHAYAVLSDPTRRRRYDEQRVGLASQRVRGSHGPASPSRGVLRGRNVEVHVHISLRDSIAGVERRIEVPRREVCAICIGAGAAPGGIGMRCPRCLGTGDTRTTGEECTRCQGSGVIGEPACSNCHGAGRKHGHTHIIVALPPGVEDGQRLVLKGDGDAGPRNGPRGDLILRVAVDPDPVLRRDGIHIRMDLAISAEDAAHGMAAEVPTLRGSKRIRIPAGVRDGEVVRIGGAGVRHQGVWWRRGDQYVTVRVMPRERTDSSG
jgi:molecular chaperone DnaJ